MSWKQHTGNRQVGDDNYLRETIRSYDNTSIEYASRFSGVDLARHRERFLESVPNTHALILDAGCGGGRDCRLLAESGLRVIGVDLSLGLLKQAAKVTDGPLACGDMRTLPFRGGAFGGVWACASLLHLNDADMGTALRQFGRVLTPGGALFLAVRHGSGSEWRVDHRGGRRWHRFFSVRVLEEELRRTGFVTEAIDVELGAATPGHWINLHAKKERP